MSLSNSDPQALRVMHSPTFMPYLGCGIAPMASGIVTGVISIHFPLQSLSRLVKTLPYKLTIQIMR